MKIWLTVGSYMAGRIAVPAGIYVCIGFCPMITVMSPNEPTNKRLQVYREAMMNLAQMTANTSS
jgi:hypothetical protein